VGLVLRGWRLADRLLPDGTRRRRLLRGALSATRRAAGVARPPATPLIPAAAPAPAPLSEPPPPELAEDSGPDPLAELRRFAELVEQTGAETVAVLFAGTQLREDEGQRPTQLALELARRGIPVVFVYWRWSPAERCPQDQLSRGILQLPVDAILGSPGSLAAAFACRRRIALFEFPYPGFFEPLALLNGAGWITVYDAIDDWEEFHRVGQAIWYEEGFERHLATAADAVFAVTVPLAERLRGLGADRVEILPNGLRPGLEVVHEAREIERGEVTVGYFGHLTEAWFDWGLVTAAARLRPAWRFFLIGYGQDPKREAGLPANVILLGKKPQRELAAWAAGWDVAIVPFRPERLAAGADPIKTYEYLALGLPVVVTAVAPPAGAERLVARVEGVEGFLAGIAEAARRRHAEGGDEERRAYAATCTWERRVDAVLAAVTGGSQRIGEKRRLFAEVP
jgi:glycosyltransferase involved in cell wall biosynthesis